MNVSQHTEHEIVRVKHIMSTQNKEEEEKTHTTWKEGFTGEDFDINLILQIRNAKHLDKIRESWNVI